jgi:branched-chain amino acid transport system ATP-binding protein
VSVLKLTGVSVSRGAGPVIRDVDLTVSSGEVVTVVGPNGAGKTSLMEAISGVIAPSAGTITIDGVSILKASRSARARRGLAHVEQGRTVFPSLTVLENVSISAASPAAAQEAIALFPGLEKRMSSPAGLLSGGEQQMVVLARAFAARPRFLLIDEMSLGLAPVVFTRLLPIVGSFAQAGAGVLLVEQFTNLALGVASRALIVSGGAVTYSGDARVLLDEPARLHASYLGGA